MSSFVGLRAVRQAKYSKSYVKSNNDIQQPSTTTSSQPSLNEGHLEKSVEVAHVLPPNVTVRLSGACGRGLWTKSQHKPGFHSVLLSSWVTSKLIFRCKSGDILFSVKPHVAVLSNRHLDDHCSNCFGSSSVAELKRCTSCRTVWYCSPVRPTLFNTSTHLYPLAHAGMPNQRLVASQARMYCSARMVKTGTVC